MLFEEKTKNNDYVPYDALWRISVEQYHAMITSGALTEDSPIELLQGWLVENMPKNPRHSTVTRLIRKFLEKLVPDGWYVDSQEPITTQDSEPEPDVIVVRGEELDYLQSHPQPKDIGIVIEVSDATLNRDQTLKKQLYARAEIPIYWIANLPDNQIEIYTEPFTGAAGADYRQRQTIGLGHIFEPVLDGKKIGSLSVSELLPVE